MGRKLFGLDIAKVVNSSISAAGGVTPITLTRITEGARSAASPLSGLPERSSSSTGQGVVSSYRDWQVDGTLVQRGDRRILVLAASLSPPATPQPGDELTFESSDSGATETLRIVEGGVTQDPAGATFTCQARAY